MNRTTIFDKPSLDRALDLCGCDEVVVQTKLLKHRGLLPCAFRRALWAVRPGGLITVEDLGVERADFPLYDVGASQVRQWGIRFLGQDADMVSYKPGGGFQMMRTTPILAPGWSAGVIFSGAASEAPALSACLDGLQGQPELGAAQGGEIVVCGPPGGEGVIKGRPGIRYLAFDAGQSERFPISAKKNFLMQSLRGPRLVVLHTRIVLEPGALAAVPREFDILAPNVRRRLGGGELEPYLSLCQLDNAWPGRAARRLPRTVRDVGQERALDLLERGCCYVDGGAILTTRRVFDVCALNPLLAWGEGEDVDWCVRAFVQGFVSDLARGCLAITQTHKWSERPNLGPLTPWAVGLAHKLKECNAALVHYAGVAKRER